MLIATMRFTQLRQADLNLLVIFAVLAEERNVSRAAERVLLSQPAVTRALQRLRELFEDDLLVRVSGEYELTPKGEKLLREVESVLPRLDRLLSGGEFNPSEETAHFRLAGTDYAARVLAAPLAKHFLAAGKDLCFTVHSLVDGVFDAMDRGRIDLLLHADDGNVPTHLCRETIFEEDFVCVVAKKSTYGHTLTLPQYLDAQHIGVTILDGLQTIPDQRLEAIGRKRHVAFRVPYFSVAIQAVAGTELVATIPRRMATLPETLHSELRITKAPKPMGKFKYLMAWHPRMDSDAPHMWLRISLRTLAESI